jgi:anti-anti-sigma regulatory factor/anti-sigma regulatory factor (Ser/Thr protein kinase)
MGLHIPGLAHRGVAVVRLRGVLSEVSTGRLVAVLRRTFATDPQLVIIDLGGLRSWDESGQAHLADIAAYLADRGGRMVLSGVGAHLRRTHPRLTALATHADVPAALAAAKAIPRPRRMPQRRPPMPGSAELLRHAYRPIPAQAKQIAGIGDWARAVLEGWQLPGDVDSVMTGLSELTANAVAYGLADTVEITMRLWRYPGDVRWLTVAVHDGNPAPPVWRTPTAKGTQRGSGLLIMAAHSHSHGWYPDATPTDARDDAPGKTVWFARRLRPLRPEGHRHHASPACS